MQKKKERDCEPVAFQVGIRAVDRARYTHEEGKETNEQTLKGPTMFCERS